MSLFRNNPELRSCFESDATNLLQRLQECLELLTREEIQVDQFEVAQEIAHTLRGAAALVGAHSIARVTADFMRLFEIADTFKFSALDRAQAIFQFARKSLDPLLSAVVDCLADRLEAMDQTCDSIHEAILAEWGDYFYQQNAEPTADTTSHAKPSPPAPPVDSTASLVNDFLNAFPENTEPPPPAPSEIPTLTVLPDPEPADAGVQPGAVLDDFLTAVGDGLTHQPTPGTTSLDPVGFLPSDAASAPSQGAAAPAGPGPATPEAGPREAAPIGGLAEDFLGAVSASRANESDSIDDFIASVEPASPAPAEKSAPATGPAPTPPSSAATEPALEVEADLLPFFYEDALTNLESMETALHRWEDDASDNASLQAIYRHTHTIKGAANSTGLLAIGRLAHTVEDALEERIEGRLAVDHHALVNLIYGLADAIKAGIRELQKSGRLTESQGIFDRVSSQVQTLRASATPNPTAAETTEPSTADAGPSTSTAKPSRSRKKSKAAPAAAAAAAGRPASEAGPALEPTAVQPVVPAPASAPSEAPAEVTPGETQLPARADQNALRVEKEGAETLEQQSIRITSQRLDALMNLIGELVVNRTRLDKKIVDIARLKEELNFCKARLLDSIGGFQERFEYSRRQKQRPGGRNRNDVAALGLGLGPAAPGAPGAPGAAANASAPGDFSDLEFDRYDDFNILARSLIEIGNDTSEIISQLDLLFGSFSEESGQFNKTTTELQNEVTRVRMVPLTFLFRRLQRAVRDAAHREQKQVEFAVSGSETQLDKVIVDQIYPPLLHLVRNAVSHGLETSEARQKTSKASTGRVSVKAYQQANQVIIEVADDGRGLNFDAIRATAIRQGLLNAEANPDDEELTNLIFRAGFSTAQTVSEVSGRGVGMDVVMAVVSRLNGTVAVESRPGAGCLFILRLPLTLAINQAMMISVGEATYAIPLSFVEHIVPFQAGSVHVSGDTELWVFRDLSMPLVRLERLFGLPPVEAAHATVVQVRVANKVLALLVGTQLSKQDIVVKSLGRLLNGHRYFSGATLSGDGNVILILDLPGIEAAVRGTAVAALRSDTPAFTTRTASAGEKRRVLVVDDSLSVRKVAEKYLQALGYESVLAVDGLDALEKLRTETVSLVMTDLEMPRMHGFELIAEIRHQPALNHLPIIVVTSRDAEKHRARARELGANDYITKPFSRDQLSQRLEQIFGAVVAA